MIKFRHLIWLVVAAIGLVLSASARALSEQNDPGRAPTRAFSSTIPWNWDRNSENRWCFTVPRKRRAPSSSRPRNAIST